MKRIKCPSSLVLLPLFITLFWFGSSVPRDGASTFSSLNNGLICPQPDSLLYENGDVILRRGQSWVSAMIAKGFPNGRDMSHCGILIQEASGWKVIHTISGRMSHRDGIRKESLADFLAEAQRGQVYHVKARIPIDRNRIVARAYHYLGQESQFDHDFDLSNKDRLYCSELVRAAYLEAGTKDIFLYSTFGDNLVVDMGSFFSDKWEVFGVKG